MTSAALYGATAAILQLVSYTTYVRLVITGGCVPNGVSWLMWSYGTGVVVFVQADLGTPLSVMGASVLCLVCAIFVTVRAFAAHERLPPARHDWLIVGTDAFILMGYLACIHGLLPLSSESAVNFVLLPAISSVLSTVPVIRTTYQDSRRERAGPWLLSALGDAFLAAAAVAEGLDWQYLVYPLVALSTQLPVAVLALGWRPGPALNVERPTAASTVEITCHGGWLRSPAESKSSPPDESWISGGAADPKPTCTPNDRKIRLEISD